MTVSYLATSYRRVAFLSPQKCSRRWLSENASKSSGPKQTKTGITAGPVGRPKRGRPPKSEAHDSSKKREEVLSKVVGWDLPPLNLWRKYFPLDKSSLHRSVIRNPDTAAMLADAFVPEGSKDKIIIDACPGTVHSILFSGVFD
jgi:transcription factor 1